MSKDKGILPALILTIICLVCTGLLGLTYSVTKEAIEAQETAMANANQQALFPDGKDFDLVDPQSKGITDSDKLTITSVAGEGGTQLGYVIEVISRGYDGAVPVMCGVDPDGKITGVRIGENTETAGLGKRIEEEGFRAQFVGRELSTDNHVDAVTAATVSSNAVKSALNVAGEVFQKLTGG